ncbi:hypothetical protein JCM8202v2_004000 [Rhodotorula sphaerocarpa]
MGDIQALVRQLEGYCDAQAGSDELAELLKPYRLALRSSPDLRVAAAYDEQLWPVYGRVWSLEADRFSSENDADEALVQAITALAGFTLSLCLQNQENQKQAVHHADPSLRRILLGLSSFVNLREPKYTDMIRICCQAFANLITANPDLADVFFAERLRLEETDKLLQRLLASPDHGTIQAVLIFILNSIHGSPIRAQVQSLSLSDLLATSKGGGAVLDRIMVIVGSVFDAEDNDAMAQGNFTSDIFGLAMPGYAISPTLVTLLKFLDGHLSLAQHAVAPASLSLMPFLVRELEHLGGSLIRDGPEQGRGRDAADAGTFQGVVLVLHCLCSIGLALEKREQEEGEVCESGRAGREEADSHLVDGVEAVVRLLAFSQTLLPPPTGRPSAAPAPTSSASESSAPAPTDGPTPDSDLAPSERTPAAETPIATESDGVAAIAQLQRTAVQYLGIVSFIPVQASRSTALRAQEAQDRIRIAGGLELVLGMCQIDDRNPTMREHALFVIRNLLKGNQANQDFVDALKPQYRVGQNGELIDLPPAQRHS